MKQKIYIAALLAGMLALAGCGGGNSTDPVGGGMSDFDRLTGQIAAATTESAVNDIDLEADGLELTAAQKTTLETAKTNRIDAINNPPPPPADAAAYATAIKAYKETDHGIGAIPTGISGLFAVGPTISYKNGGVEISVVTKGGASTGTAATHPAKGWSGSKYSFDYDGTKQEGAIFTNLHGPAPQLYLDFVNAQHSISGISAENYDSTNREAATGVLTFAANTASLDVKNIVVSTGLIPSAPSTGQRSTITLAAAGSVMGSYYGIAGTFACPAGGDNCVITRDDKGKITTSFNITFTPTASGDARDNAIVMNAVDDNEYLHFGYWMDGGEIYTFVGEKGYSGTVADYSTSNTTATYKGAAGGYYTHGTAAGEFTAKAELKAVFGTGGTTATDAAVGSAHNGISGTISDFAATTGGATLDAWKLTLGKADLPSSGSFAGPVKGDTTSPDAASGKWSANFHEYTTQPTPADDVPAIPDAVTGQFTGNFGAGSHVAGAFAAEKE